MTLTNIHDRNFLQKRFLLIDYFRKKALSCMSDRVLNTPQLHKYAEYAQSQRQS